MELNKQNLKIWDSKQNDLQLLREKINEEKAILISEFEESHAGVLDQIEKITEEINKEKDEFKEQAVIMFNQTQEKKLIGGIGIRVGTRLIYKEAAALKYAESHGLFLQLDKRSFEKHAKETQIDFVLQESKVTVTFPKELKFEGGN